MIGKTYKLTFTDTTHQLMNKLINHGFNIRDILNAGVILFNKASLKERGIAIAASKTKQKQEFDDAIQTILDVNIEILDPDSPRGKAAQAIRDAFGHEADRAAADVVNGAACDADNCDENSKAC